MKRNLLFIVIMIIILVGIGCSKNDDSSSPTGIDFTNRSWATDLDFFLGIDSDSYMTLQLESSEQVESCELKINNIAINTTNWKYSDDDGGDLLDSWYCDFESGDIPAELTFESGSLFNISLNINGKSYSGNIKIPFKPTVNFPVFDVNQDYSFSWELPENPITQMIWLGCGGDDWENCVFENYQLNGSKRDYSIPKSTYSDFVDNENMWFEVGIDAANYKDLDKCLFLSVAGQSYDSYDNSQFSKEKRNKQILKNIINNR